MKFFEFIQAYMMLIFAGSLAVTGWHFITRGKEEILPDGSIKRTGKIFKGWYFFFTKSLGKKKVFFRGKQFKNLLFLYNIEFPANDFSLHEDNTQDNVVFIKPNGVYLRTEEIQLQGKAINYYTNHVRQLEAALQCCTYLRGNEVTFFKEYEIYRFPWWIRDPLAVCATCFASIYGSIFYWSIVKLAPVLFSWTPHVLIAQLLFWVAFCFSLAVLNTALAKKYN